jgi:tRNA(adenine34) deaminase
MPRRRTRSRSHAEGADRRWVARVKTVSTFPPAGLFTRDTETIARSMASRRVSPKGIGSGIRMIQYFINRAGRNLPASRRRELERAKRLLQERRERESAGSGSRSPRRAPTRSRARAARVSSRN